MGLYNLVRGAASITERFYFVWRKLPSEVFGRGGKKGRDDLKDRNRSLRGFRS